MTEFSDKLASSVLSSRKKSAVLEYTWMLGKCDKGWSNTVLEARKKFSFNIEHGEPQLRCGVNMNVRRLFRELRR